MDVKGRENEKKGDVKRKGKSLRENEKKRGERQCGYAGEEE